jgi:hypothetical protein
MYRYLILYSKVYNSFHRITGFEFNSNTDILHYFDFPHFFAYIDESFLPFSSSRCFVVGVILKCWFQVLTWVLVTL